MRSRIICTLLASLLGTWGTANLPAQDANEAPATAPATAAVPAPTPALTPGQLLEELAKVTKPLWRQQYRPAIERNFTDRFKASLALGAVMADISIAGMARDAQQVQNLLQDEEAIEKSLGITDRMRSPRQRFAVVAAQADWPNFSKFTERAYEKQLEVLTAQRDGDLATVLTTGRWIRTWQVCASVVHGKKLENDLLSIGSTELLTQVSSTLETLSAKAPATDRCIKILSKRIGQIEKLWRQSADPAQPETRLKTTLDILNELVSHLVQDRPATAAPKPAPQQE